MALPNVNELTQKLATMSDQQMQQYAKMNQDDPYVLAMAVSEKNRRAAMRSAAQPQQQQPTVADAEIGSMAAPAGLSALPAQNLESMDTVQAAGGGVIGFQQGGLYDIPGLVTGDPRIQGLVQGREETGAAEQKKWLPAFWEALMQGKTVDEVRGAAPVHEEAPAPAAAPAAPAAAPKGGLADIAAGMGKAIEATPPSKTDGIAAVAPKPVAAAPAQKAAPPAQKAAAPQAPASTAEDRLRKALDPALKAKDELITRNEALSKEDMAAAREELSRFDKRTKDAKPVGSEREKRLRQQEEGLFGEEGQALGNAAMRGFLAILGGTSRSSRVNIARGLAVGLNSFDKRMAQVEERRANINKNLDQIETLREQAATASAEKRAAIESRIETLRSAGARASFDLFKQLGYETDMTIGTESFKAAEDERKVRQEQTWKSGENAKDRAARSADARVSAAPKAPKSLNLDEAYLDYYKSYQDQALKSGLPPAMPLKSKTEFSRETGILPLVNTTPTPEKVVYPRK